MKKYDRLLGKEIQYISLLPDKNAVKYTKNVFLPLFFICGDSSYADTKKNKQMFSLYVIEYLYVWTDFKILVYDR